MLMRIAIVWMVALWMIGVVGIVVPAQAGEYESGFGFGISVPDVWLVLTRSEIQESADHFFAEGADEGGRTKLGSVPLAMRRAVHDRVRAGELEMYFRRTPELGSFVDNVNVMTQFASLPNSPAQLVSVQLDDVFGEVEAQNLPGTINEHPNWRRRSPISVEEFCTDINPSY